MITPRAVLEALATLVQREISCRDRDPLVGGGVAESVVPGGAAVPVLRRVQRPAGERGLALIQVQTTDAITNLVAPAAVPRQRVILNVRWQSGASGGSCSLDITKGAAFTLTGADSIEADAQIVASGPGALANGPTKRVEAAVAFGSGFAARPAYATSATIALVGGVASARIAVPDKASAMIVETDTPASLPNLTANFFSDLAGGGAAVYSKINPNANGTGIWQGCEFVNFLSTVNANITPVWELSL